MTNIRIFKRNGYIVGFECSGHTGYGEYGSDILCATISALSQSCVLGIKKILKLKPKVTKRDNDGYLKIEFSNITDIENITKAQVLFETFKVSIEDLLKEYSDYIMMEVIENVY